MLRPLLVWLGFILTESLLGALRRLVTSPELELAMRAAGVAVGVLLILALAWASLGWMRIRTPRHALAVGGTWAALTLAFEAALGRATGLSWAQIAADYAPAGGGFMALGLLAMALAPWMALRQRRRSSGNRAQRGLR
ncbi:MAG: hypothetical protein JF588_05975 [Caulobacterales bacterium]|nr:hypothetical protein [Caulobacterales bacterium]